MNGREVNRAQSAREMTEEINRVTDAAVTGVAETGATGNEMVETGAAEVGVAGAGAVETGVHERTDDGGWATRGVTEEQARGIGNAAMTRVLEMAEVDNGYARNEIGPNLSSVGEASALEEAERQARSYDNMLPEMMSRRELKEDRDARIQVETQEEIGKTAAVEVGRLLRQPRIDLDGFEQMFREKRDRMLGSFKNPRKIGDRN